MHVTPMAVRLRHVAMLGFCLVGQCPLWALCSPSVKSKADALNAACYPRDVTGCRRLEGHQVVNTMTSLNILVSRATQIGTIY